jgi:hypothetical protein
VAKKTNTPKPAKTNTPTPAAAGTAESPRLAAAAEYVGVSLADMMNRRDALIRQVAVLERQIADAGKRTGASVVARLQGAVSRKAPAPAKKAKKGNGKRKRPAPPAVPMVEATTRASAADAKARASQRARTSNRSGNR